MRVETPALCMNACCQLIVKEYTDAMHGYFI